MARQPRLDVAHRPRLIAQRASDRQPCFFNNIDQVRYLQELRECCAVHAFALITNNVHLLTTSTASSQIGRLMQPLGQRYVRYGNDRYRRTGTLALTVLRRPRLDRPPA